MGMRVNFSYGAKNGALDHFLSTPLETFRSFLKVESENDQVILSGEPLLIPLMDDIIKRGAAAFVPDTAEQARMLDILVDDFYFWCDLYHQALLVDVDVGTLKVYRYEAVEPEIHKCFGEETGRFWHFILNGRPIGRSEKLFPYTSAEKGYPNSFWTYDEVGFLYCRMLPYQEDFNTLFGTEGSIVATAFEAVKNAFNKEVGLIIEVA